MEVFLFLVDVLVCSSSSLQYWSMLVLSFSFLLFLSDLLDTSLASITELVSPLDKVVVCLNCLILCCGSCNWKLSCLCHEHFPFVLHLNLLWLSIISLFSDYIVHSVGLWNLDLEFDVFWMFSVQLASNSDLLLCLLLILNDSVKIVYTNLKILGDLTVGFPGFVLWFDEGVPVWNMILQVSLKFVVCMTFGDVSSVRCKMCCDLWLCSFGSNAMCLLENDFQFGGGFISELGSLIHCFISSSSV